MVCQVLIFFPSTIVFITLKIKTILAKHEQGASFMACGHAKASGGISACITTAGPGATNLVTGIANAYVDKQPILLSPERHQLIYLVKGVYRKVPVKAAQ